MTTAEYLYNISKRFITGISREHAYRGDLQQLLESLVPDVLVTNEPARIACGAPDYILTRKDIPVGYIEAKDINTDLKSKNLKEQFDRYRASLDNLIFTDYLDFQLYIDGEFKTSIKIAEIRDEHITPLPENYETFENLIRDFTLHIGQTIKSSKKLAEMMAGKARMLSDVIERAIVSDEETSENSSLKDQLKAFEQILIHDIKPKEFADIYAQTIAYGMFAARLHDPTLPTFSRQEAAQLIPKTNPFLRKLFQYVAGYDLDSRIVWIVDGLADIFRAADIAAILKNFGKSTQTHDPIIHFYETFLSEYDPKLRKARGVWYTPEPVVNFIVRAVDDILKTEFGLKDGLADTSKTKIKTKIATKATADRRSVVKEEYIEQEVHKVQILDPATGTGTFLAQVIKEIHKNFVGQQGIWSNYVENHLIPRLNGFELLMASYAMAHLKLDLLLTETGYKPTKEQRFRIYLTNSLEEHHPETGTLFANWLSDEANEANRVKRDTPVMVVLGNPPYSVSSSNKSAWIQNLISDYKKDLNEKKINLDDDYIKFIRFGQHFIDKNGEGILAYISNNSFIDGITHRQMRKELLKSFDKIYVLDLHGSTKKNEKTPEGLKDENVFDIMQGVSINIFLKSNFKKNKELGQIYHSELYGTRARKYNALLKSSFNEINWRKIENNTQYYFYVPKDFHKEDIYKNHFKINDLFIKFGNGIGTDRDLLFYDFNEGVIQKRFETFYSEGCFDNSFRNKYNVKDSSSYNLLEKRLNTKYNSKFIRLSLYRPFDKLYFYYNPKLISRPANEIMSNFQDKNISLLITRQLSSQEFKHVFVSDSICDRDPLSTATKERTQVFPLYLFLESNDQQRIGQTRNSPEESTHGRITNLSTGIVKQIADKIGLIFTNEREASNGSFSPIDILDYIYAVLHSPTYREKYKEFLKIDFPRVPYPKDAATFWKLVQQGGELRQLHLLESPEVKDFITQYPEDGSNTVEKVKFVECYEFKIGNEIHHYDPVQKMGNVYINDTQFFQMVPLAVFEFYIGGYQPAQKWLKDRKGRNLSFDDIKHYQSMVVALSETIRIMEEIDKIEIE